ncbi:MAG: hypothetical protein AAFV53_02405 [Myxococcota bacterium]
MKTAAVSGRGILEEMTSPKKKSLQYLRDGVLFLPSFLPTADFEMVQAECRKMRGGMKPEKGSLAVGRMGRYVDRRSNTYTLFTAETIIRRMSRLVGSPMVPSAYPIELRAYRAGSGMEWHQDDPLYEDPQCELVLCLDNNSDSRTEWIDASGARTAEWTPPNAALLIRAGDAGPPHRVTPLKTGERMILKMVWARPGSPRLASFYEHIDSLPGLRDRHRKQANPGRDGRSGKGKRRR